LNEFSIQISSSYIFVIAYQPELLRLKLDHFIFSYEKTFILTGIELPSPAADPLEHQRQLKLAVTTVLTKLDPELALHQLNYVRVVKTPKPSVMEVECASVERYLSLFYYKVMCESYCLQVRWEPTRVKHLLGVPL
jgi:hypothetical protein